MEENPLNDNIYFLFNGKKHALERPSTIKKFMENLDLNPPVFVILNNKLIKEVEYTTIIKSNDNLKIVSFIFGG